ncbi:MAG: hypothetical protein ACXWT4_16955 [Methylobacter sp.]
MRDMRKMNIKNLKLWITNTQAHLGLASQFTSQLLQDISVTSWRELANKQLRTCARFLCLQ